MSRSPSYIRDSNLTKLAYEEWKKCDPLQFGSGASPMRTIRSRPVFDLPEGARIFRKERWRAPMIAGVRRGAGAVLWVAVPPGERGHERFRYLLHALLDIGVEPAFRRDGFVGFLRGYRAGADLEYLLGAGGGRGSALWHASGWHFYEAGVVADAYT